MSDTASTLVLFTTTFPYDGAAEQTFLQPELEHLRARFPRVIIVPDEIRGVRLPVPEGVEIDETHAATQRARGSKLGRSLIAAKSSLLWTELLRKPGITAKPSALNLALWFIGKAEITNTWLDDFMARRGLAASPAILYTYWFFNTTLGLSRGRRRYPHALVVTRAHGYDLYEERHVPAYIPARSRTLSLIDAVFPDSEAGERYLRERYGALPRVCETARLGVRDPTFLAAPSTDGTFRIISCSLMVAVKRLPLLIDGIARAARHRPEQRFEWQHFGEGELRALIESRVEERMPPNVAVYLPGYPGLEAVMSHYRDRPVDLFANVSASEGTPVSVMEAISCGIPVMATAVGGNPEIVSERNGRLLSANPEPDEIASVILSFLDDPEWASRKREGSREMWTERFDAACNYSDLAGSLASLAKVPDQRAVRAPHRHSEGGL